MTQEIFNATQQLLAAGFYLFPVDQRKKALIKGWESNATNDGNVINDMFQGRKDANPQLAIACGSSGLFVLDVDVKHENDGFCALERLMEQHGALPETVTVCTPSGGVHFYFRGTGKSTRGTLGEGLDTRSQGGYVVCPPSVLDTGKVYTWEQGRALGEVEIAQAPQWLIRLTNIKTAIRKESHFEEDQVIPEGERNDTLYRRACSLRGKGLTHEEILGAIAVINAERCQPPLEDDEVFRIVDSACKHDPGQDKKKPGRPKKDWAGLTEQMDVLEMESLTDTGNARRLVRNFGTNIRYTAQLGWLVWDGTRWRPDDDGQIERYCKDTAARIQAEALSVDPEEDKDLHFDILRHATSSLNQTRLKAMKENASSEPNVRIRHDILDVDPWLYNVANGTIDLRNGNLREHRQQDYLTKMTSVVYQPEAQCPNWLQFLTEIMCGDHEMVRFLQRVVGYTLTGLTTEQCLFVLYGTGANGKSAFLGVLKHLLGEYGRTAEFRTFLERTSDNIRNDLARLAGARFVAGSEGDAGQYLSEAVVKSLTGGEMITARFLHKEFFEFKPCFTIFLATNHKPHIANQDEGIWRRIRLIPFEKSIPKDEQNPHLVEDDLLPELPGILAWAVQGCLAWQDGGLQPPARVLEATEEYREEMDNLGPFVEACFIVRDDYQTTSADIHQVYVKWCKDNNIKRPLAQNTLIAKLVERGFPKYRTNKERGLKRLKPKLSWSHTGNLHVSDLIAHLN